MKTDDFEGEHVVQTAAPVCLEEAMVARVKYSIILDGVGCGG
jgi:hypothetical protein